MGEWHRRCRFHPRCQIHLGLPRPLRFSEANYEEMRELYLRERLGLTEIARIFDARRETIARIVQNWKD